LIDIKLIVILLPLDQVVMDVSKTVAEEEMRIERTLMEYLKLLGDRPVHTQGAIEVNEFDEYTLTNTIGFLFKMRELLLKKDFSTARALVLEKQKKDIEFCEEGMLLVTEALMRMNDNLNNITYLFDNDCLEVCVEACTYYITNQDEEKAKKSFYLIAVGVWTNPYECFPGAFIGECERCNGWLGSLSLLRRYCLLATCENDDFST
jgi:hypothetical protein